MRPKPQEGQAPFLDRIGTCQAIFLTTAMHERNAYWFRERTGAPIFCPRQSVDLLDGTIDHAYGEDEALPGGLEGFWTGDDREGDAVLRWTASDGTRVLFAGDAINGQTKPGRFDGAVEPFWMRSGSIRLRLPGQVPAETFGARFERLRDVEADWVGVGPQPATDRGGRVGHSPGPGRGSS